MERVIDATTIRVDGRGEEKEGRAPEPLVREMADKKKSGGRSLGVDP